MQNYTYVGIGASAGGLKAFEELISLLPQTSNYVYIIAQHLDPHKKSALVDILSRCTSLKVHAITETTSFLPNNIYIIPSGYDLTYKNARLSLCKTETLKHKPTPSIDSLFQTLALHKREKSIAILLTGSGHDGTLGMQEIKKNGGMTIVQEPQEAYCKSMPQSAIDSGSVDYILPIQEIGKKLFTAVKIQVLTPLETIEQLLQNREYFDTKKYKSETILRRINKRMLLVHVNTLEEYLEYIASNEEELHLLYQNILIGVTQFFRDKEAFSVLESEVYNYLKDKPEYYELKVWSIACSTGEEAYSIAIVIDQVSKRLEKKFHIKIFASDIDEKALLKARSASYSEESITDIAPDILQNYFTKTDNGYKVTEEIRKNIVFTKHNILSDPPFINQDIISCRNLLIYIKPEAQQELFTLLHYTLKDDGILFLGSSESTLISIKYFTTISSESKIYKKEKLKNPPKISSHYFSKHLEEKNDFSVEGSTNKSDLNIEEDISTIIFDFFVPNCIVIDKEFSIVYKKGVLPFVKMPDGFMTLNVLDHLHKELQYSARHAISLAFTTQTVQSTKFIELDLGEEKIFVRMIANPYTKTPTTSMLLLYFQELHADDLQFNVSDLKLPDESFVIEGLTVQVKQIQENNNLLSEELSGYKEKMQLLNEELQSSNEELQSSNEELETSNEELQSSNEELHVSIVNEQKLQEKFSSILNSSQNGIIGLDIEGNHTFVNQATLKILGFSEDELISNNAHKLWHHTKADGSYFPVEECQLHSHYMNNRSLRTEDLFWKKDGTAIDVEVLQNPLLEDGKVVGAVLSFHDITEKKRLEKELEHEHRLANLYANTAGTLLLTLDRDGNITMVNREGANLLKTTQEDLVGKNWIDNFIPKKQIKEIKAVFASIISGDELLVSHYKNYIIDIEGMQHLLSWTNHYIKDENGTIIGVISSAIDITKEETLSKKLLEQENLYKLTFEQANIGIAHTTLDGHWIDTNGYLSQLLGYTKEEFLEISVADITHKEDRDVDKQMIAQLMNKKSNFYHAEKRYIHKNGSIIWVALSVVLLRDDFGEALYLLKIIRDISQMKLLMYQLEKQNEKFEKIIEFTPIPLMLYNADGEILLTNKIFDTTLGYSKNELSTIDNLIKMFFKNENKENIKKIKKYYENPLLVSDVEQVIMTKSGEKRVGILNAVLLNKVEIDVKEMYLIAIVDITDLQKKDELMIAQSRQAAMGDMLAMIAHQWRQPLSVISLLANNVKVKLDLEEEITKENIEHLISSLNKQTQYLSQTIDDFRDFFKPDKVKEQVSMQTVIEKVTNLMNKTLQNNNIELVVPQNCEMKVSIYMNQLIQVIINLINNAKDAIKTKNISEGRIELSLKEEKKNIILSICDNGGGIDASIKEKIGQPYVSTKSKNGTGLGLYMSIMIVTNYLNGKIKWDSDEKGSCFYITLLP